MKLINIIYEYLESIKYSVKKRTYLHYFKLAEIYLARNIGETKLSKLDSDELNKFILKLRNDNNLSISTVKSVKSVLNRSLSFAKNKGLLKKNIKINLALKSNYAPNIKNLSDREIKILEDYIISNNKIYHFGVLISLYTGLRIGELLALRWSNVDLKNKILSVTATTCDISFRGKTFHIEDSPKTISSARQIPITNDLLKILKKLKDFQCGQSEFVVSRKSGKQIKVRAYQLAFDNLLKKLHLNHYGFHALQHTFATRCNKCGVDIKTLSELLGHSDPSVTLKIYVHTDIKTKRLALDLVTKKLDAKSN